MSSTNRLWASAAQARMHQALVQQLSRAGAVPSADLHCEPHAMTLPYEPARHPQLVVQVVFRDGSAHAQLQASSRIFRGGRHPAALPTQQQCLHASAALHAIAASNAIAALLHPSQIRWHEPMTRRQ